MTNNYYQRLSAWLSPEQRNDIKDISQNVSWEQGRQGTGYQKADLVKEAIASWAVDRALSVIGNPTEYDAWLLQYPTGSEIPPHIDPAQKGMCHVRFNAVVVGGAGGVLCLESQEMPLDVGDAYVFRPDSIEHSVTTVQEGSRLMLSVGANIDPAQARSLGLA